jgi:predicted metal-dependent hydrolase
MKITSKELKKIGKIDFRINNRAKYLRIHIKPFKGIFVTIPRGISQRKAENFVLSKKEWIKKHLNKVKEFENNVVENRAKIKPVDRNEAKILLINKLEELTDKFNFSYNRVSIRNQKTRWGSCSSKNNISLNCNLINLPEKLIDYVILHELVHTRVKNHGADFWKEMGKYIEDPRALNKELKRYKSAFFHL